MWPIAITILSWAFFAGIFTVKLDTVIENQKMMSQDLKDWKAQAEQRIGRNSVEVARLKDKVGLQ